MLIERKTVWAALTVIVVTSGCRTLPVTEGHLFRPGGCDARTYPDSTAGYEINPSNLTTRDSTRLEILVLKHRRPRAVLVYFGGNTVRHCPGTLATPEGSAFIANTAGLGLTVVMLNYRGYGNSRGRASLELGKQDAVALLDAVREDPTLAHLPIILHGQSLGSVFATHTATGREVRALVLESPPTTIEQVLRGAMPWYAKPFVRLRVAPGLADDHRAMIRNVSVPTLIITGSGDPMTPPRMARALARHVEGAEVEIVRGGKHGNLVLLPQFWSKYAAFVEEALVHRSSHEQ